MTAKGKLTRKELNAPDEFMTLGHKGMSWATTHKTKIIGAVVGLLVIVAGAWAWRHFSKRGDLTASQAFADALDVTRRPIKGDFNAKDDDDDRKPFDSVKDRAKAAIEKLDALVEKHKGAAVAKLAQVHRGNQLLVLGEHDKAIAAYEAFLNSKPTDDLLIALATENLGFAYEAKKDTDKAIAQFEKLATGKVNAERGQFHVGRIYQAKGDLAKAREAFQKSIDKAKELKVDWWAQDVEARMGLLDLEK